MKFKKESRIIRQCILCGDRHVILVEKEDLDEYHSDNRRNIQDIFPYLSAGEREIMISGICGKCFDNKFKDEEEE